MQISLNIIDILCLHNFFWIRSNSRITESTRDTYNYGQNQFPPEYDKSNTGIRTDPEENM